MDNKTKKYEAELTPQITFGDFQEKIRLVWTNMQPICKVCHTDAHIKADCLRIKKKACHRCGGFEHLIRVCPRIHRNHKQEPSTQEHRRNSATKESNPSSKNTGREVNLLELMNVNQPRYLAKQKDVDRAEDAMDTEDESTLPATPVVPTGAPHEQETQEPTEPVKPKTVVLTPADSSTTVDPPTTSKSHQDDGLDDNELAAQDEQEIVHHINDESEYEAGNTSESSVEYSSYRDRLNLGKAKKKTSTADDNTAKEASQKRSIRELASIPLGSDQEGSVKKVFKQQEDNQMNEEVQGNSSATKSL